MQQVLVSDERTQLGLLNLGVLRHPNIEKRPTLYFDRSFSANNVEYVYNLAPLILNLLLRPFLAPLPRKGP